MILYSDKKFLLKIADSGDIYIYNIDMNLKPTQKNIEDSLIEISPIKWDLTSTGFEQDLKTLLKKNPSSEF